MFGKTKEKDQKSAKLSGPRDIPETVKKYITSAEMVDSGILPFLKAVTKSSDKGNGTNDIYIFDPADAEARNIKVHNFDTLKENPNLIIAEGWFDEAAKKAELTPKMTMPKVKFFTRQEIQKQIEGLTEPGSSVFFYTNAGSGVGGPLGRGAALIKLNTASDGKKVKKYSIYCVSVIDMQPIPKSEAEKIWDADKADQIAKWVADSHSPRFC